MVSTVNTTLVGGSKLGSNRSHWWNHFATAAQARLVMAFTECTLAPGQDGDASQFFAKVTGFGYNDMISLPTLTKEAILENLKRRFKVCAAQTARRRTPCR